MSVRRICSSSLLLPLLAALGGCQAYSMAQLALQERQYEQDRLIEAQIRGELMADPLLADARIDVDVYLKEVTLTGVASPAQAARAHAIVGAVPLVEDVDAQWLRYLAGADDD